MFFITVFTYLNSGTISHCVLYHRIYILTQWNDLILCSLSPYLHTYKVERYAIVFFINVFTNLPGGTIWQCVLYHSIYILTPWNDLTVCSLSPYLHTYTVERSDIVFFITVFTYLHSGTIWYCVLYHRIYILTQWNDLILCSLSPCLHTYTVERSGIVFFITVFTYLHSGTIWQCVLYHRIYILTQWNDLT